MARAPRSSVSKTSGQGISRLSYQKGYSMGNKGTKQRAMPAKAEKLKTGKSYAKADDIGARDINVSYGSSIQDLESMSDLAEKPMKPDIKDALAKPKKLK